MTHVTQKKNNNKYKVEVIFKRQVKHVFIVCVFLYRKNHNKILQNNI